MEQDIQAIKQMLQETQARIDKLQHEVHTIRRQMWWSSVWSMIRLLIIIIPILLTLWFFQPLFKNMYESWQVIMQVLPGAQTNGSVLDERSFQQLLEQYQNANQTR